MQLNDTRIDTRSLSRAAVWAGICGRANLPQLYDDAISQCAVTGTAPLVRRRYLLHDTAIEDEVHFDADRAVTFVTLVPDEFRQSTLTISIDEPAVGFVFLRFVYVLRGRVAPLTAPESAAIRDAYTQADITFVARLRELASP